MTRRKADAALAVNTILWGATFVLVKGTLSNISPILFLALRFSVAAAALPLLLRLPMPIRAADFGPGMLAGSLLFLGYAFQTVGLQFTSAPKSAFLTGMTSVMVPLLATFVYKSRPRFSELLGVLVATAGMGLMTLEGPFGSMNRGDALTLACAIAFAGHIVTVGHFSGKMHFETLSAFQVTTAALWAGSLFWWIERPRVAWRPGVIFTVVVTGLLATALAFTVQAWAQQYTTSTRTALIYMLEPVVAWLTSYILAGEGLTRRAAAGAALILGGVLLVEAKPLNPRPHPPK